jgi:D-alanine-D-alanine ligase
VSRQRITVLLADPRLPDPSKPGGRFTADDFDQVVRLRRALAEIDSLQFEYLDDHETLIEQLRDAPPSLALNFCDTGFRNDARHELHVAALLEMLGIPYSGCGPLALGLCFDKSLVRALALACDVPVPAETYIASGQDVPRFALPAFIKPNRADGSLGITARSIVHDRSAALSCIELLRRQLPGADLLAQQWLPGREFSVGLIGNPDDGFDMLPLLEVDYSALDPALPHLLDYGSKTDPDSPYWQHVRFHEARLDATTIARLRGWCEALFRRIELRDYARFDFRTGEDGVPRLMEVNPNPAWCWDGKLAHMAALAGRSHGNLLAAIIDAARRRTRRDRHA